MSKNPTADALIEHANRIAGFESTPADTCVIHDAGRPITRALASINATTGDLLLAKQLGCDGFLLHHPLAGPARLNFHRVLERMIDMLVEHGVPAEAARAATRPLRRRSFYADHAADWDHLASTARLLDMTLLNIHLPADELGRLEMVDAIKKLHEDATVEDVIHALRTIPELAAPANEILHVPEGPTGTAGRVAVMHAGGTNGGADAAEALFDSTANHSRGPVRTVVYIHLSGDSAKRLEERAAEGKPGTVIVTGHLASDAIGMNLLIESLTETFGIEIVPHGGLTPFPRSAATQR
jgi:hypothetical protein